METTFKSMKDRDYDVLAVDGVDVDWLMKIPNLPSFDDKVFAELVGTFAGGPVGNFACMASHLGLAVASLCTVGSDDGGSKILADFKRFGVDCSYVDIDPLSITPFVVVLVDPSGEKAVVIPEMAVRTKRPLDFEAIGRSRYVYLSAVKPDRFLQVATEAKKVGTKVMADIEPSPAINKEKAEEIVRMCDIASFNEQGFVAAFNQEFSIKRAQELLLLGPEVIVVTRGKKGVVALSREEVIEFPAYQVDVQDTTGAGDTFNASFLFAVSKGYDLEYSVRFASGAAAIIIQSLGTRAHFPALSAVEDFVNKNKIKKLGEKE